MAGVSGYVSDPNPYFGIVKARALQFEFRMSGPEIHPPTPATPAMRPMEIPGKGSEPSKVLPIAKAGNSSAIRSQL